jgi:hypothetical protein
LPLILKFAYDKISNVRLNTVIVLKKLSKIINSKENLKDIQSRLDDLKTDNDMDVLNALVDNQ